MKMNIVHIPAKKEPAAGQAFFYVMKPRHTRCAVSLVRIAEGSSCPSISAASSKRKQQPGKRFGRERIGKSPGAHVGVPANHFGELAGHVLPYPVPVRAYGFAGGSKPGGVPGEKAGILLPPVRQALKEPHDARLCVGKTGAASGAENFLPHTLSTVAAVRSSLESK